MKIYFDTEFTGLTKDTDLVSIGLIAENSSTFYGEINDFDITKCDQWVKDNVVSKLKYYNKYDCYYKENDHSIETLDTKHRVGIQLALWLNTFLEEIEFVSDVAHYDFTLLIDLLTQGKSALDLPEYITPAVYDINQLMAQKLNLTMQQAFDYSREQLLEELFKYNPYKEHKHNALYDAVVIKEIYNSLTGTVFALKEIRDTYTTIADITMEQYTYLRINFPDLWYALISPDTFLDKLDKKIEELERND